ncbi:MAG: SPOR domain-containing protein [Elusimicrobiota bacterium]|jgi:cell division septation protein DedD
MKRTIFALIGCVGLAVPSAWTAEPVSLAAIVTEEDRVEFHFSAPIREKVRFEKDPPRLLIDWEGASLNVAARTFEGKGSTVKSVKATQLATDPEPIARVVVEMSGYSIYSIDWDGSIMHLAMGDAAMRPRAIQEESAAPARPAAAVRRKSSPAVTLTPKPAAAPSPELPPPSLGGSAPVPAAPVKPKTQAELVKAQPGQEAPPSSFEKAPAAPAAAPEAAAPVVAKAEAPKPSQPAKAQKTASQFLVQVGSFGDEAKALALKKTIEGSVSPVEVLKVDVAGKAFYQVRVGPFDGRPAAQQASDKLKGMGHASAYVLTKR